MCSNKYCPIYKQCDKHAIQVKVCMESKKEEDFEIADISKELGLSEIFEDFISETLEDL
ncbi:MAG: hypothetical protein ABIA04_06560 [Pseudomonadota bacterium]